CYFIYDYWWHWCSSFFTNDWRIGYIIWTNRWMYYWFHPYRLLYRQIFRDHQFYDYKCYYRSHYRYVHYINIWYDLVKNSRQFNLDECIFKRFSSIYRSWFNQSRLSRMDWYNSS